MVCGVGPPYVQLLHRDCPEGSNNCPWSSHNTQTKHSVLHPGRFCDSASPFVNYLLGKYNHAVVQNISGNTKAVI